MSKRILLSGKVQGVGCRQYCLRYGKLNKLTGAVSNLTNGKVEVLLSVEDMDLIKNFVSDLRENRLDYSFWGSIDEINVSNYEGPIHGDYLF